MDSKGIKEKLRKGEYSLTNKQKCKSEVWNRFKVIVNDKGEVIENVVACSTCFQVLVFHSHKTGTSTLRKHVCQKESTKITSYLTTKLDLKRPSTAQKNLITKACVQYVSKDLRSFQSVAGKGFTELAQLFIDIGSKSGRVDANYLLPDPTTVSRCLVSTAAELRNTVAFELQTHLNEGGGGAATLDMWTDDYRKIYYLCLTFHYIQKDWCLRERVLCTTKWDYTQKKTGENIKSAIIQSLRKYNLEDFFPKITYVTDQGANMIASLKTVTRLNCSSHIPNTVLHKTFETNDNEFECSDLQSLVNAGKSLVTYFKQSNLQSFLKKTLKAPVETRWNSLYAMFDSVNMYEDVKKLLCERSEEHRLDELNKELVENIVTFLKPFKIASEELEASSKPTLHLVIVWLKIIEKHLQISANDGMIISRLKTKCLTILRDKFKIHILHKLAVFFHPKLKSLKLLDSDDDRNDVRNEVKRLLKEKEKFRSEYTSRDGPGSRNKLNENKQAKRRKLDDHLHDVEDSSDENTDSETDEYDLYIKMKTPTEEDFDLLLWWKKNETLLPMLSAIARVIFNIPASSAPTLKEKTRQNYSTD